MSESDDARLVRETLGGDLKAFELLVDRYQQAVFNIAYRITGDAADAEDVAQSAFLKAFEKLRSFNPRFKFFSWLYRIAVNEALNAEKKRRHYDVLDESTAPGHSPDEHVDREDIVQRCIQKLTPDYRAVLVLRHFEDLSYEEIGRALQLPVKTVKSRLFSARSMLRDFLTQQGLTLE
jgi:RNA polymerase sigma-70 factor (ECF subfamily)